MLKYRNNSDIIDISETANGNDVEFHIVLKKESDAGKMNQIQAYFEGNRVLTDVLFYVHVNNRYQIIVRSDYHVEFVLQLMKHRLLEGVDWS